MKSAIKNIFLAVLSVLGVVVLCRWVHRRQVVILMYHGLVETDDPVEWTQLPVAKFRRQMEHLRRHYHPVSLHDAVEYLSGRSVLPDYPAVVTFDDGYLSNYTLARPILKELHIPATVFITTSLIEGRTPASGKLWFDAVYSLSPKLDGNTWDLTSYGLPCFTIASEGDRVRAVERICACLKTLSTQERRDTVKRLVQAFPPEVDDRYHGADWSHIRDARPLMEPGAHTVNHDILSQLPTEEARWEIVESKRIIESAVESPVEFFAYPNGLREDFTDETRNLVAAAGYRAALSTIEGVNKQGDDLYGLKRIGIGSDSSMIWYRMALTGFFQHWRALFGRA